MKTEFVSITHPPLGLTPEQYIVYIARVSNPENQLNTGTADRLIEYLIKHKHWSPFEFVDMTVSIETSLAIATQILRHKSFSFQQYSGRYSDMTELESVLLRKQSSKNRQSSTDDIVNTTLNRAVKTLLDHSMDVYQELLDNGVARECARMVLPQTTKTHLYMKGSVRSWIHYLELRTKPDTQLEHRLVAEAILSIFNEQFPNIAKNFA